MHAPAVGVPSLESPVDLHIFMQQLGETVNVPKRGAKIVRNRITKSFEPLISHQEFLCLPRYCFLGLFALRQVPRDFSETDKVAILVS